MRWGVIIWLLVFGAAGYTLGMLLSTKTPGISPFLSCVRLAEIGHSLVFPNRQVPPEQIAHCHKEPLKWSSAR